jgi:hypothetical protein
MMKPMFLKFNLTGRLFICIGTSLQYLDPHNDHFVMGECYPEAISDSDGYNVIKKDEDVLLIKDKNGLPLYVDGADFMLLKESISPIALQPYCLN